MVILIFFHIMSLISWAITFKTQEFRQKIEIFYQHPNFCIVFILRNYNKYLPKYSMKFENSNFFWILSLIPWAITFKTQEFRQKIEIFYQHPNFYIVFILRNYNKYLPKYSMKFENSNFFLDFVTHFVGYNL